MDNASVAPSITYGCTFPASPYMRLAQKVDGKNLERKGCFSCLHYSEVAGMRLVQSALLSFTTLSVPSPLLHNDIVPMLAGASYLTVNSKVGTDSAYNNP